MRFNVGETYTFVRVLFTPGSRRFGRLFWPWEDNLEKIEVINLTCKEHHKVAWDQDPDGKKENDGFIFEDETGHLWYNQYPTASYGQLDDSNDRMVRKHFEEEELLVYENGKAKRDENGKLVHVPGTEEKFKEYESYFWKPMNSAQNMLGNIYRAVNPRERDPHKLSETERKALELHMNEVIKLVEEKSGKKVSFVPLKFKNETNNEAMKADPYYIAQIGDSDDGS